MLVDINRYNCFISPKTGNKLIFDGRKLSTKDKVETYEVVSGLPVLVDFHKSLLSDDLLKKNDISSPIKRDQTDGIKKLLKKIVSPPKKSTKANVQYIFDQYFHEKFRVLVVGGATIGQNMERFYEDKDLELFSFDVYASENVNFIADAHNIPIMDDYFDCVIIQAVLEHVLRPGQVVDEIYRVLKNNGIVYSETPFLQQVHEGPYDFTRFTESGHRFLFKKFELIKSGVSAGPGTQMLWTLDYFVRSVFRSVKLGKVIKVLFFWLRYFDSIIPENYKVDSASGVYFLGMKTDVECNDSDIIGHYKGIDHK